MMTYAEETGYRWTWINKIFFKFKGHYYTHLCKHTFGNVDLNVSVTISYKENESNFQHRKTNSFCTEQFSQNRNICNCI